MKKKKIEKETLLTIGVIVIFLAILAYFVVPLMITTKDIPSYVKGDLKEIYEWSRTDIGAQILEQVPCYCGCMTSGHIHTRHCFWKDDGTFDKHGVTCSICLDIAKRSKVMYEEGKDICETRYTIDKFYAASADLGTKTPMPQGCEGYDFDFDTSELGNAREIHIAEAYDLYTNNPDVVFIDVREEESIMNSGGKIIKDALWLPLFELTNNLDQIDCNVPNIFLCEGTYEGFECSASPAAARIVMDKKGCSDKNMMYLLEGHGTWEEAGYPVEDLSSRK